MMSISVNSRILSITLTSIAIFASNAYQCIDSPQRIITAGGTSAQTCEEVVNSMPFCTTAIASHCPLSCNACAEFECSDSGATFLFNEGERICSNAQFVPPVLMAQVCLLPRLAETCRGTCNYCTASTAAPSVDISSMPSMGPSVSPSLVPSGSLSTGPTTYQSSAPSEVSSSMPSMGPTVSSVPSSSPSVAPTLIYDYDINFDEAGLDNDDKIDDDDYGYYGVGSNVDYYHPAISFVNFGFYPGHDTPNSGYYYGVITPDNVSFNQFGDPAIIECYGGSFNIDSMYLTTAWQPNAPVDFIGIKNDGTPVDFSVTLPNITTPILVDSLFDDFTDLIQLVINTPREGDVLVMDDLQIGITAECDMTYDFMSSTKTEETEHNVFGTTDTTISRPNFSPIYPRSYWSGR